MLKNLFLQFCTASLAVGIVQDGERGAVVLTPSFGEDGKLSGLDLEFQAPVPVAAADAAQQQQQAHQDLAPQDKYAGQGNSTQGSNAQAQNLSGNVELDPVTGQPKAKASEQV